MPYRSNEMNMAVSWDVGEFNQKKTLREIQEEFQLNISKYSAALE